MQDIRQKAQTYLRANPLKHLVHLKFMHLYGEAVVCSLLEQGRQTAVLLRYPVDLVVRDALSYPMAEQVFLPAAQSVEMAQALLSYMRDNRLLNGPRVIKFCEAETEAVFMQALPLQFLNTVISFTSAPDAQFEPDPDVKIESQPCEACIQLYVENGYQPAEIYKYFEQGATAFTLYADGNPLCTCMVYQNFDRVWEIAGLHTRGFARGKGYARRVVQTALWFLLKAEHTPRYQVEFTNHASIRVAESLGLQPCLYFKHMLYKPT